MTGCLLLKIHLVKKGKDFRDFLNKNSLEILENCKIEPAILSLKKLDRFQFERLGYFCVDPDSTSENPILNRTVTLRDIWSKIQQQQK